MANFIDIFDASFARATEEKEPQGDFFATFYDRFMAADPRVTRAFAATDMDRQRSIIKKSFFYMVNFYATAEITDYVQRIAESHGPRHYNIEPELYDLWLETLMGVLRERDPAYEPEVELAWRVVLSPGIAYMKFIYQIQAASDDGREDGAPEA